jgi:uncharacterized repeat protein (TIGR01451 family)
MEKNNKMKLAFSYMAAILLIATALVFAPTVSASEIELKKNTDPVGQSYYYLGDTIHYVLEVGNPSTNAATNYLDFVEDILPDSSSVILATGVTQAPGDSDTYYQDYVVDVNDLQQIGGRWRVLNTLHVEGTDSLEDIIDATTSKSSIIIRPSTDVDIDDVDPSEVISGGSVDLTFSETNDGYDDLYDVYVELWYWDSSSGLHYYDTYDILTPPTGDDGDGILNAGTPGETWTWTVNNFGPITEYTEFYVYGFGTDDLGNLWGYSTYPGTTTIDKYDEQEFAEDSVDVVVASTYMSWEILPIEIYKGDYVDLTFSEHNDGDLDLTGVYVELWYDVGSGKNYIDTYDYSTPPTGDVSDAVLNPGETWTWTVNVGPITDDAITFYMYGFGYYDSQLIGICSGYPGAGPTPDICDPDEWGFTGTITRWPGTEVAISVDPEVVPSGDPVTITIDEYNSGDLDLYDVYVELWYDDGTGITYHDTYDILTPPTDDGDGDTILSPGETWIWTDTFGPITADTTFYVFGFGTADLDDDDRVVGPCNHPEVMPDICDPDEYDYDDVTVETGGCTLTPGYWKTHSRHGPAKYIDWDCDIDEDDTFFTNGYGYTYHQILSAPPKGDAYIILARHYIAAVLNGCNNDDNLPTEVQGWIGDAEDYFNGITSLSRSEIIELAGKLGNFNEGLYSDAWPHCE